MEDNLIYTVINEILIKHNINALWEETNIPEIDGVLTINYKGIVQKFYVEVKKELRNFQLENVFKLVQKEYPLLIIVENLFPNMKHILNEHGIGYIDLKGNINIETEKFLIKIEGKQQKLLQPEKYGRAFTKAGLKVILLFLLDDKKINNTYREIAKDAGIAIGNVKLILEGLIEEGYALRKNEKDLKLINKKDLLQKWVTAYNEKLKPSLRLGNFKFLNQNDFNNWKNLNIDTTKTLWGGEAAGNILTGYLIPEILTLYTEEKKLDIVKNYRLVPDNEGNIRVFQKFWHMPDNKKQIPYLIAYADLMGTNNRRCIETAQKIYEQNLTNTFK
ncbi:MAG TPA: type IV toxin-antitoxin system AbiEi family antitoxin [Bacteroidales bacterium]|nr:type IV toxin-antitoxin system AbiEi family antitoxin [Bacteroidales bacterium]